ncbi:MAG TPA: S8 family serine peptidase [Phenylobacterium sp.]|uniref:S8 family serine peptidase n=1 Tax=Phenylobacterium sp. TaxID=1871053 RepID=UPI002B4969CB|nr:S8 family serine peptidase [Phenylobacterium sp.]HKR89911.1 S8 family serine peptidase [Phenylobacterium sp.]
MRKRPPAPAWIRIAAVAATMLACAGPASSQLLGRGLGGIVGGASGGLTRDLGRPLSETVGAADGTLAEVRRQAVQRLIREHPEAVEADAEGAPVVRGEVLALAPTEQALAAARAAGFRIGARTSAPELGLDSVTLLAPPGLSAREALRRLRALDPQGQYDLDHIYQQGGGVAGPAADRGLPASRRAIRVGLVDGSVDVSHPAFRGTRVTQQAFALGGAKVTAHATALASLLAGADGAFRGAAPGGEVLVADVYGTTAAGGSAAAIAQGLAWLARNRVGVINISLVGPPNLVLGAAVRGLTARGFLLVAAVGNDGPAAPPLYPAAYPGVIAVTGVDARRRVLPEAGRGPQVAFAAPGAEMAAAMPGGGFAEVRGTSFAAPLVAGALAADLPSPDPTTAAAAVRRLAAAAQDLGARGRDPVFGFGLVAFDQRTDPARVAARVGALRGP